MCDGNTKRIFQLEAEHRTLALEYHRRLATYSVTIMSGTVAVLGCLVSSHHLSYVQTPGSIRWSLYLMFIFLLLATAAELAGVQLYARYTASFRAYEQARQNNDVSLTGKFEERKHQRYKFVSITRATTQVSAQLGFMLFAVFVFYLLHNILST